MEIVKELGKSHVVEYLEKNQTENYMIRMISDNKIKGIPLCRITESSNEVELKFDVSNMISLKRKYEDKILHFEDLKNIIYGINSILSTGMEYLFDEQLYIFDPNYIFFDMQDESLNMLYIPGIECNNLHEDTYHLLSDFFLDKTDHKEEKAVSIAYQFYRMSKEILFSLSDFCTLIDKEECKKICNSSYSNSSVSSVPENNEYSLGSVNDINSEYDEMLIPPKDKKPTIDNLIRSSVISGVVAAVSLIFYFFAGKSSIYNKQFFSVTVIICIISFLLILKSIINAISHKKEIELEKDMTGKKVTVNEYWSDDKDTQLFDDTTVVFDAKESKSLSLSWTENGEKKKETVNGTCAVLGKKFDEVDVFISDPTVSRKHAKVTLKGNSIFLQDLGSTNGTYIDGTKLSPGENRKIFYNQDFFLGKVQVRVI